jgi:ABC-type lipoprotein export system ATPase subunit
MEGKSDKKTVVACRSVSRRYQDGVRQVDALQEFTFSFPGASLIAITGPSGSGKSTLLSIMAAIDYASSGTVEIAGTELGGLSTVEQSEFRAEHISYLYPEFNLIPVLSVYENISLALSIKHLPEPEIDARIQQSLEFLAIEDHAFDRPGTLSTGERARAGLARAIAAGNEVLIVDEPTAHLDEENARMVADLLHTVADDPDRTVIVATHDPVVAEAAHLTIRLRDGRII